MPRKQFYADLESARIGHGIYGVKNIQQGEDDGQLTLSVDVAGSAMPITVHAMVNDLGDYPQKHEYYIFASDDAPAAVARALETRLPSTHGKSIKELLLRITETLANASGHDEGAESPLLSGEESEADDSDDFDLDPPSLRIPLLGPKASATNGGRADTSVSGLLRSRIREDLQAAKSAGFRVGHIGPLLDGYNAIVTLSCRVKRFGLSEEAMQAWKVTPAEYFTILIHYPTGYMGNEQLLGCNKSRLRSSLDIRVGIGQKYKPTSSEAIAAFATTQREDAAKSDFKAFQDSTGFRDVFISQPLNHLINERLVTLLRYRESGLDWTGAEKCWLENHGRDLSVDELTKQRGLFSETSKKTDYPDIVQADHLRDLPALGHDMREIQVQDEQKRFSFPLLAMQFALRHFVRCTEFCLVCHKHLNQDMGAIKPYVCDTPLCLYQYMSLGFGPSLEHEIISQPYTVDLLISFCYTSAADGKLVNFPTGLSLSLPLSLASTSTASVTHPKYSQQATTSKNTFSRHFAAGTNIRYEKNRQEILFEDRDKPCPVRVGDWIILEFRNDFEMYHCRIMETTYYPSVTTGPLLSASFALASAQPTENAQLAALTPPDTTSVMHNGIPAVTGAEASSGMWTEAQFEVYNANFDDLTAEGKRETIIGLLNTLPNIKEMRDFLISRRSPRLGQWLDRISPSALGILRWIIASNRACIVQSDESDDSLTSAGSRDKVHGMSNYIQFRFAMGAPDKERRFQKAVKDTTKRLKLQYPTLFAWHGSPLHNWHGIIREGLNFNQTLHGRAYGHGCYHSLQSATSLGYSNLNAPINGKSSWPATLLIMSHALSLNEIVNAPSEFVSRSPHLVIAQLDWIQTRYLFVQSSGTLSRNAEVQKPTQIHPQDPSMTPWGTGGPIVLPARASRVVPYRKRKDTPKSSTLTPKLAKKLKLGDGSAEPIVIDDEDDVNGDDSSSRASDEDDLDLLCEDVLVDNADSSHSRTAEHKAASSLVPRSDFIPGELDHSILPKMPEPSYANIATSRRLQSDLKALLRVQDSQPLEELGWFLDSSKVDNVYQWIVELHSFEAFRDNGTDIPLVADMKKAAVKSIVLEVRFPGSYPMSPPFVRVIRPRFLGFQQGGGGHVTAGGALCMELLTNSGWSAVSSVESVLLQVRMAIASTDPQPARLETSDLKEYGAGEAFEAYKRACRVHGWEIPADFSQMATE